MYLDNKKVFVAGSAGCVGISIIRHLLDNFPTVKIRAAYLHTKPIYYDESIENVQCDLRLQSDCRRVIDGCDCAIMAAANSGGSNIAITQPSNYINDNLIMNAQMLEAFHFHNIRRVVYIGSATLYQEFEGHIKENGLDLNKDPYSVYYGFGWVVRYIEKLCQYWHDKHNMEIVIARVSNVFGAYSRFNPVTSNFIPALIRKAVDKVDPFEVWGSLDVTRDVIYSEDLARAIVMMLDNNAIKFDVFNIGSGVKTTVGDVVKWSLKYAGHNPLEIKYNDSKPTTNKFKALDCTKAKELLGWEPEFTVKQGIKKTTEWWTVNKDWWTK